MTQTEVPRLQILPVWRALLGRILGLGGASVDMWDGINVGAGKSNRVTDHGVHVGVTVIKAIAVA